MGLAGEKTLTTVPVELVRVIDRTGTLKLRKVELEGGVSTKDKVRFALPPVQPVVQVVLPTPLHELREKIAATKRNERRIRFIEHPTEVGTGDDAAHASACSKSVGFCYQKTLTPSERAEAAKRRKLPKC